MIQDSLIPGYIIGKTLLINSPVFVFEAVRAHDATRVIITYLQAPSTSPQAAHLQTEYNILKSIESQGIIQAHSIETTPHGIALILEYLDCPTLKSLLVKQPLDIARFLIISIQICDILGQIHQQTICHHNLNTAHVLVDTKDNRVTLTHFNFATRISEQFPEDQTRSTPLERALFLAPEQTGKTQRPIDLRSDIYSLGIMMYEMLTGHVPFISDSIDDIFHAHITQTPERLFALNPVVPQVLSDIVMKCLEKEPDLRYQNSFTLRDDLIQCQTELLETLSISPFEIAKGNVPVRLLMPNILIGRQTEQDQLIESFLRSASGEKEIALISGPGGIGKTELVVTLKTRIMQKKGIFLFGKYDPYKQNIPYRAITAAFQAFARQLRLEPESVLNRYRQDFLKAFGKNGKIITQLIPEMTHIIGPQPDLIPLMSEEEHNRFLIVVKSFVKVIADQEHPLVLFLDDLEWADAPSLALLYELHTDPFIRHLMLIGTYSDSGEHKSETLQAFLNKLELLDQHALSMTLNPLTMEEVRDWLHSILRKDKPINSDFVHWIFSHTQGNALFIKYLVRNLFENGLLEGDVQSILNQQQPQKVMDIVNNTLNALPPASQEMLQIISIGPEYPLSELAALHNLSQQEVETAIIPAINAGLLKIYGLRIACTHDCILEVCYSRLKETDRMRMHYRRIGQHLLSVLRPDSSAMQLIETAFHLNNAISLCVTEADRIQLAQLNLKAGIHARISSAYDPALHLLQTGISLLPPKAWDTHHPLTFQLHKEAVRCAFLIGRFDKLDSQITEIRSHLVDKLEIVELNEIRIEAYLSQKNLTASISTGRDTLAILGMQIPAHPSKFHIGLEFIRALMTYRGRTPESLLAAERITDPQLLTIMKLLNMTVSSAFWSNPTLLPFIVLRLANLSMRHGLSTHSCFAYIAFGYIFWMIGNIKNSYAMGKLGIQLLDKLEAHDQTCRIHTIWNSFIRIWAEPIRVTLIPLKQASQYGMETGDLEFAAHALAVLSMHNFMITANLEQAEDLCLRSLKTMKSINQNGPYDMTQCLLYCIQQLLGRTGNTFDPEAIRLQFQKRQNGSGAFLASYYLGLAAFILNDYEKAHIYFEQAMSDINNVVCTVHFGFAHFYSAMIQIQRAHKLSRRERMKTMRKIRKSHKRLQHWAKFSPENFLHKYYLLSAELARLQNRTEHASMYYVQAANAAHSAGSILDEALIADFSGQFFLENNVRYEAERALQTAHSRFKDWQAWTKVKQLESCYAPLFSFDSEIASESDLSHPKTEPSFLLQHTAEANFQFLLPHSNSEQLIEKFLAYMIDQINVQRAVLILRNPSDGRLHVQAIRHKTENAAQFYSFRPLTAYKEIALSVTAFVERTKQSVIIEDANTHDEFCLDAYIQNTNQHAIMCIPILNLDSLSGIIYLENTFETKTFTDSTRQIISQMADQVAIAIENIRIFAEKECQINLQTQELNAAHKTIAEQGQELLTLRHTLKKMKAEVEKANNYKATFLYHMTYALRAPMHMINGVLDILSRSPKVLPDPDLATPIQIAHKNGIRQMRLINRILEINTFASDKVHLNMAPFAVSELTTGFAETMDELLAHKPVIFAIENWIENSDLIIFNDKERLQQVLEMLLRNAAQSTEYGTITLRLLHQQYDHQLIIEIADTGVGMSKENMEHVFHYYHRSKKTRADKHEDTALELLLCKSVIEALGGQVLVQSEKGKGSKFKFWIPCLEYDNGEVSESKVSAPDLNHLKTKQLLICCNDPDNQQLLTLMLNRNIQFTMVNNEQEVRDHLETNTVDLLLIDFDHSNSIGPWVLTDFIAICPDLPIIAIYSDLQKDKRILLKDLGISEFLQKPFSEQALHMLIDRNC